MSRKGPERPQKSLKLQTVLKRVQKVWTVPKVAKMYLKVPEKVLNVPKDSERPQKVLKDPKIAKWL